MKIKRKARNIVSPCTTSKTRQPQDKKLGYGKYRLPTVDDVPAGQYYSEIAYIENTRTARSNKKAVAVYYDIAKFSDVYRKANKLLNSGEKLKVLHIKQIYPLDSDAYIRFLESMYEALGLEYDDDIDLNECVGKTEAISLGYTSATGIGGIQERCPYGYEDFVYIYEQEQAKYSEACIGVECDEYGNLI